MELELESILLPGVEDKRPMVIAGPCSAETEEQVMCTAKQLAEKGMKIFRAGIWKPRTKPGGFEGVGVDGLAWLKEVKKETGMYVSTEVATSKHVYECLKAGIDILWIGARTTANPFAMQEIADALKGVDIPVFVKNPVTRSGTLDRCPGTYQQCRSETSGSHPPWFQQLRQEVVPQSAAMAYPHRVASPHPELADHLRSQPHRW